MRVVVLVVLLSLTRTAAAGIVCSEEDDLETYAKQLEATAASPAKAKDLAFEWAYCLDNNQKRKARIVKACTTIAARLDVTKPSDDDAYRTQELCIPVLASFGVNPIKTKTKDVDYVADKLAAKYPLHEDPSYVFHFLELSGDPRVLPKVIELYRENLATAAKKTPTGWHAQNWIRWHRAALTLIKTRGTKAELAFLDEVAASTTDKRVAAWVGYARDAIKKRDP